MALHFYILHKCYDLKCFKKYLILKKKLGFYLFLHRLQGWCCEKKYDLNARKCKSISFYRGLKPGMFQYVIGHSDLERVDVINDLGVLVDNWMTFVDHIRSIESKSARILGFIKRISWHYNDPYTYKTLYVAFVRPGLEYASCVWSPHQEFHSARIERIQHNFIRFALRGLSWTPQPLPPYESRCLLLGLEVLSDRRRIAAALFVRDILCRRIESAYFADLLRFESNSYPGGGMLD
jgi:hypothetical protein